MNEIIIVSGLPRSGTSMMMKMLEAGGVKVLTDNVRTADEDNPKGYYEYEKVKQTRVDPSWVEGATGRAVKMVSMLLYDLPGDRRYRVIFMRRAMDEILASQQRMLERKGVTAEQDDTKMEELFSRHLGEIEKWLSQQNNFDVLYVAYADVIQNPADAARNVNDFLGLELDTEKMSGIVDPSLYRQRTGVK